MHFLRSLVRHRSWCFLRKYLSHYFIGRESRRNTPGECDFSFSQRPRIDATITNRGPDGRDSASKIAETCGRRMLKRHECRDPGFLSTSERSVCAIELLKIAYPAANTASFS